MTTKKENKTKYKFYESKKGKRPSKTDKPVSTIGLSNPVVVAANRISALLDACLGVVGEFDYAGNVYRVYVSDPDKVDAFRFFLRRRHDLGNLALEVELYAVSKGVAEKVDSASYKVTNDERVRLFKKIFDNAGFIPDYHGVVDQTGTQWNFFEFPCYSTLRYQADSLQNLHGYRSELVSDVVVDVFDAPDMRIS